MRDEERQGVNWLSGSGRAVCGARRAFDVHVNLPRALRSSRSGIRENSARPPATPVEALTRSSRSGFTLLEMLLVVTLVLAMSIIVVATFVKTYRSEMLRSEARMLMATVQQARYQAVVRQYPMMLKFDFANQAYWVEMSSETVTNLTSQMFSMSTNSLDSTTSTSNPTAVVDTTDLSTNAVIVALPAMTRRELAPPLKLAQVQTLEGDVQAADLATITCYPNGSCQGGMIVLIGVNNDSLGIELDPLTSLPRLVLDAQPK